LVEADISHVRKLRWLSSIIRCLGRVAGSWLYRAGGVVVALAAGRGVSAVRSVRQSCWESWWGRSVPVGARGRHGFFVLVEEGNALGGDGRAGGTFKAFG